MLFEVIEEKVTLLGWFNETGIIQPKVHRQCRKRDLEITQ